MFCLQLRREESLRWHLVDRVSHRLLRRELRIMRESSMRETISPVESPRSNSSPRFLNWANVKSLEFQSRITCLSFASISFSFTAEIQMSWQQQHTHVTWLQQHILVLAQQHPTHMSRLQQQHILTTWHIPEIHRCAGSNNRHNNCSTHFYLLLVLQERGLKDVAQCEVLTLYVECVSSEFCDALPMSWLHGLVSHQLQQWHHVIEVLNGLAQVLIRLPLLQGPRKFTTSAENTDGIQTLAIPCLQHTHTTLHYTWNYNIIGDSFSAHSQV